jgi:type I restriction-modification system DNA methylase subunit
LLASNNILKSRGEFIVEFIESEFAKYTITLSILSFLFGTIIKFWLNKETRAFQNSLEGKLDEYKHKLEMERIRLQIAYGGIFEKQANALLDLHQSLIDLQHQADIAMNAAPEDNQSKMEFRKVWTQLRIEYSKNRALFPEEIDKSAKEFLEKILKAILAYKTVERKILRTPSDEEFDKLAEMQKQAIDVIIVEIPKIEQKIVEAMRVRLGVSSAV